MRYRSASFMLAACAAMATAQPCDPPTDAIAYYPFEDNADDAGGHGLHGTASGQVSFGPGVIGSAAEFDGVTAKIIVGDPPALRLQPPFSFAAWVNRRSSGTIDDVFGHGCGGAIVWLSGSEQLSFGRQCGGQRVTATLQDNRWTHIAAVYTGDTALLYVNGGLATSVPMTHLFTYGNDLWIGGDPSRPVSELFDGWIDELYFFDRSLEPGEIVALASGKAADLTGDGAINTNDLFAFLALYHAHDADADFAPDGVINTNDFFALLAAYQAGCP